jgi:translation elongation factor P/translation initiation factor 5A
MSSKWIKPSELPENFHGHCWVCYKGTLFSEMFKPTCEVVQNHYNNGRAQYWRDSEGCWAFMADESYRVMIVEKPDTITDEEWR